METTTNKTESLTGLPYPSFGNPVNPNPDPMPSAWQCQVLLHPFSPPFPDDPTPATPFFQVCIATVTFVENEAMSVQITGADGRNWWYNIGDDFTQLSLDKGVTWETIDMGWTLPTTQWLTESSVCAGSSYLNWMNGQMLDWWKTPAPPPPGPPPTAFGSTWYWLNTSPELMGMPFRMMFGQAPFSPIMGDPNQLAFFQNYSFSYFTGYNFSGVVIPQEWIEPAIPGFSFGNLPNYDVFVWNDNFEMTVFMTPVNEAFNPLPTHVQYVWKSDEDYKVMTDRAQNTLMWYNFNPQSSIIIEEALLYGPAPATMPPNTVKGLLIDTYNNSSQKCAPMPFAQEPPNWATPAVGDGTIMACIADNPELCPGNNIMVLGVLFPPAGPYTQGTWLWTWYSPFDDGSNGLHSRPVTFMQSDSGVGVGTSLALADYFAYRELQSPADPSIFDLPAVCEIQ